ncbi:MAG: hypothetical protein FVQ81_13010 [Candidatus Glassbacteria bacterium]|nr:hypothetical protein [Candidatus Glassbacteria bacterium]
MANRRAKAAFVYRRTLIVICLTIPGFCSQAAAGFHVPWQRPEPPPLCEPERDRGYFRPEYGELAQRLDPEKLDWIVRNFPVLGWQGMDPRIYRPMPVPGTHEERGFRYDPILRHLQLEAIFHFGPEKGNGTLIEDAIWVDSDRMLTVNRGSDNLSLVDISQPDLIGTFDAPRGITAFEINRQADELYLVESGTNGMLIFALDGGSSPVDTLRLDFTPGAVLQSPGDRYLYFTDEAAQSIVRYDLIGESEAAYLQVDLRPPLFMAAHLPSETIVLVSREDGQVRLVDMDRFAQRPDRLSAGKAVTRLAVSDDDDELYLISAADCSRSEIHVLTVEQRAFTIRLLAVLSGSVRGLAAPEGGGEVYAVAGEGLYRIDPAGRGRPKRVDLGESARGVAVGKDRVFVSAGLDHVFALDRKLENQPERVRVEMGPGPLLLRDGKLHTVNCLSNSITVLNEKDLEEEVSVLLGVLLGRMYYRDPLIVVNNLFRNNVMVLDPESYRIEEIIEAGGSIHYDAVANAYAVFGDSLVTRLPSPPSAAALNSYHDFSDGVRLFIQAGAGDRYVVVDQNRFISRIDLSSNFRRGAIPLPAPALGLAALEDTAYVLAEREMYSFTLDDNVGFDRTWSVRPARFSPPWLAADGFSPGRGSLLKYVAGTRLLDVFTARGDISVIRNDPDTTLSWVAAGGTVYVFDSVKAQLLTSYNLRWNILDIILPAFGRNAYAVATDQVVAFDRRTLLRYDDIRAGGQPVYARGDYLFLLHPDFNRRLVVADGTRGDVYQELELPLVPTDAAASDERLFLLGAAQGSIAIFVNWIDSARLPRSADGRVWDPQADRRAGYHR